MPSAFREWALIDGNERPLRLVPVILRGHVDRPHRKIEPDPARPRYILTESGVGYCFNAHDGAPG
jgi:DNA-binding response OmpR family regulator